MAIFIAQRERLWYLALGLLFLAACWLRWPYPEPGWIHIDERVMLLNPLKLWSGDLNPHFFIYPTLHIYLTSALYYCYFVVGQSLPMADFVAYQVFVNGAELIEVARGFNSLLSAATAVVVALIGRRLYGMRSGALAGLLFAALPLSVRFAHLATTDTPATLWISCAMYFAVRIAQGAHIRDSVWAGVCVGLAGSSKYPAALVGFPVAVACLLYRPTWRQLALWIAGAVSVLVFALTSPYVVLDAQNAWQDLALMGRVHLGAAATKADIPSWRYYLQYGLRYGIGWMGMVGLVVGLLWRPLQRRREEWVVVAAFAVFFALLMAAESVFMRYALPLAPLVVLLWVRPLVPWRQLATPLLALVLIAEPLYASWQTRQLLAGDDTREQVERKLAAEAPEGAWLLHMPGFIGSIRVVDPALIFSHENRFLLSYEHRDLMQAYQMLSRRRDLPPLHLGLGSGSLQSYRAAAGEPIGGRAYVLWYQHAIIPPITDDAAKALLEQCNWLEDYGTGGEGAVYEAVDWLFVPIGGFGAVERTGPRIRMGQVPLKSKAAGLNSADFFGLLHGIWLGEEKVEVEDWQGAIELYEAIAQTPVPPHFILSTGYFYRYLINYAIALDKTGRRKLAMHMWETALELNPDHRRNEEILTYLQR